MRNVEPVNNIAKRYKRLWLTAEADNQQFVLDQLGGYTTADDQEVEFAEAAAVTALLMLRLPNIERRRLAEQLAGAAEGLC